MTQKSIYGKMRKLIIMLITGLLVLVISFLIVRFTTSIQHQSSAPLGIQQANERVYPDEFYFNDDNLVSTKGSNYQIPNDVYEHYQVFNIRSAECLKRFANIVSTSNIHSSSVYDSFLGKTVVLTSDINYGKAFPDNNEINIGDHTTVGANHIFKGDFEGNNHTISNFIVGDQYFYVAPSYAQYFMYYGLFTYFGGSLTNLHLKHVTTKDIWEGNVNDSRHYMSIMIGYLAEHARIENCSLSDFKVISSSGTTTGGGLVGEAIGEAFITNCKLSSFEIRGDGSFNVGGVGGLLGKASGSKVQIENCELSNFKMISNYNVAGLICDASGSNVIVENCWLHDFEIGSNYMGAGLIGDASGNQVLVNNCKLLGFTISATSCAGLIHNVSGNQVSIYHCLLRDFSMEGYGASSGLIYSCSTLSKDVNLNIEQCAVDNFETNDSVESSALICKFDFILNHFKNININIKDVYVHSETKNLSYAPTKANLQTVKWPTQCYENVVAHSPDSQNCNWVGVNGSNIATSKSYKDGFDWSSEGGDISSTIWYWGGDEYNDGWMYLREFIEWKELKFESSDKEVGTVSPNSIQVPVEYQAPASLPARNNVSVLKRAIKAEIKQVGYIVSKWLFDEKDTFIVHFTREYGALKVVAPMSNDSNVEYLSDNPQFNIDDVYHVARGSVVNLKFISTTKKKTDHVQSEQVFLYDQIKISFVAFDRIKQSDGSYLYNNEKTIEATLTLSDVGYIFYKQDNFKEKLTDVKGSSINIITLPSIMQKTYNVTVK